MRRSSPTGIQTLIECVNLGGSDARLLEVCPRPAGRSATELTTDARDWLHADGYRVSDVDGAHPTPAQQEHLNSSGTQSIDLESNFAAKATVHSPSPAV